MPSWSPAASAELPPPVDARSGARSQSHCYSRSQSCRRHHTRRCWHFTAVGVRRFRRPLLRFQICTVALRAHASDVFPDLDLAGDLSIQLGCEVCGFVDYLSPPE
jgi:hypothetical protein